MQLEATENFNQYLTKIDLGKLHLWLEYALGLLASFWINLQGKYGKEILEYEEQKNIDK